MSEHKEESSPLPPPPVDLPSLPGENENQELLVVDVAELPSLMGKESKEEPPHKALIPPKQASLPPPVAKVLNLPPPTALLRPKKTSEPTDTTATLERSSSSSFDDVVVVREKQKHTKPKKKRRDKPTSNPSPLSIDDTFETYFHRTYGTAEESQQRILEDNIENIEHSVRELKKDIGSHKTTHKSTLFEQLEGIANTLTIEVRKCHESEEARKTTIQTVKSFREMCERLVVICEGVNSVEGVVASDPRLETVQQLLKKFSTEEGSYISKLMCLQRFFRSPLNEGVISTREDTVLFSELEPILELHKNLLKDIGFTLTNFPRVPIGELLQFYMPKFSPYLQYIENSQEARELLDKLMKENKEFRNRLKELEAMNDHKLVDLMQYPLRKLEQCIMYAEQFYHLSPPKSSDRPRLEMVIEQFQELLDSSGKKKNIADQLLKLQTIGNEIEGFDENLVVPDRELIHAGPIRVKVDATGERHGDYVYLFTDILLFVQKKSSKKYIFVEKIGMHTVTLSDATDSCSFHLTKQTSPNAKKFEYTLTAESAQQKDEWYLYFSNVQRDVIRYRKVFGVPLKTLVKREQRNIPDFVKKSINFIREYGLKTEGIFRLSGRATQIEKLRDQLDQGKKVFFSPGMDVHSVANLFKQWLREMSEPILTWKLYDDFTAAHGKADKQDKLKALYDLLNNRLPKINRYCFQHMIKLLTEVIANEKYTKLNAKTLSVVFAPNVLVDGDPDANPFSAQFGAVNAVFEEMLLNYDFLFKDIEEERTKTKSKKKASLTRTPSRKRVLRSASMAKVASVEPKVVEKPPVNSIVKECRSNASSPLLIAKKINTSESKTEKSGILLFHDKERWVERYCLVANSSFLIYKSADLDKKNRVRIPFSNIITVKADPSLGKPFAFQLEKKKEKFILAAASNEDLLEWIGAVTPFITNKMH